VAGGSMLMDQKFERNTALFLFFIGIVLLTFGGLYYYFQLQCSLKFEGDVQQSYQTIRAADQAQIAIDEASMDVGRFLNTTDATNIGNLPELIISAKINIEALTQLTDDNADQQNSLKEMQPLFEKKLTFLNKIVSQYAAGDQAGAIATASDKDRTILTKQIVQKIIDVKHNEVQQLQDFTFKFHNELEKAKLIFLSVGIICVFLFLVSYIVLRRYLK
jgi:CHASE3 domain sensor protein